jgi:hypothetical protein
MRRVGWLLGVVPRTLVPLAFLALLHATATTADATICGNGITEAGEECDDGAVCVGGTNAGSACTAEGNCTGEGVCREGTHLGWVCGTDADCPASTCTHCVAVGGDGCAANCTLEHDVVIDLVPGQVVAGGDEITPGTSGVVLRSDSPPLALPLGGSQTLTIGSVRDDKITGVIKANAPLLVPVGGAACACVRGVEYKTCGGTLFDAGGAGSTNCTEGFGGGSANACANKKPCTAVFGKGNSAAGVVGCNGLDGADFSLTQDHTGGGNSCTDGTQCPSGTCVLDPNVFPAGSMTCGAFAPVFESTGTGGPGSAVLLNSIAVGTIIGPCIGTGSEYGLDGKFCTHDDPPDALGIASVAPMVTGTTMATITHANGTDETLGPVAVSGTPLSCTALASGNAGGAALAGAFAAINEANLLDSVVTTQLVAQAPPGVPTPTSTPSPVPPTEIPPTEVPPTASPTEIPPTEVPPTASPTEISSTPSPTPAPTSCVGDCNHSGTVTVDEILTLVNIALGEALPSSCVAGDVNHDDQVTIDEILTAVNNALNGCAGT